MNFHRLKLAIVLCGCLLPSVVWGQVNQTLETQLASLAAEVREIITNDRILSGVTLRLDNVLRKGMPDANFDQRIRTELENLLGDLLDKPSQAKDTAFLSVTYAYLKSELPNLIGVRTIQLTSEVLYRGQPIELRTKEFDVDTRRPKDVTVKPLKREVNNPSDISAILGSTVAINPKTAINEKLVKIDEAFSRPTFATVEQSQVAAESNKDFTIEIRRSLQGDDATVTLTPKNINGLAFAELEIGNTYEVILYNYSPTHDVVVKLSIDGLDASSAFCIDVDEKGERLVYPGYHVAKATGGKPGMHTVPGWLHTVKATGENDNVFQFVVNKLGSGAATAKKVIGKTGVITAEFYLASAPEEMIPRDGQGETGVGKNMRVDYALKGLKLAETASSTVTIRYSRTTTD